MKGRRTSPVYYAPQHLWPMISLWFRQGLDTHKIAFLLKLSEASVANALPLALAEQRR